MDQSKCLTPSSGFTDWWVVDSKGNVFSEHPENRGLLFQLCLLSQSHKKSKYCQAPTQTQLVSLVGFLSVTQLSACLLGLFQRKSSKCRKKTTPLDLFSVRSWLPSYQLPVSLLKYHHFNLKIFFFPSGIFLLPLMLQLSSLGVSNSGKMHI